MRVLHFFWNKQKLTLIPRRRFCSDEICEARFISSESYLTSGGWQQSDSESIQVFLPCQKILKENCLR